jgi:hypothetical protein
MDQRELLVDFVRAPDIDNGEKERVSVKAPDASNLEADGVAARDGDGGMLGRVLIYASIIAVVAVTIWKWDA